MTSLQLEPSTHAPCTSTTLRAAVGLAVCADASAAKSVASRCASGIVAATTRSSIFTPSAAMAGYGQREHQREEPKGQGPIRHESSPHGSIGSVSVLQD